MKVKPQRSLKAELIWDLSILTLLALIISELMLVVFIRSNLPEQLQDIARSYLSSVHEGFAQRPEYKAAMLAPEQQRQEEITKAFENYFRKLNPTGSWARVSLQYLPERTLGSYLETIRRPFLLIIPTVAEFRWRASEDKEGTLLYSWSVEPIHFALTKYKWFVFFMTLVVGGFLVTFGYFLLFRKNVLAPIKDLSVVSRAFLNEDWSTRCEPQRHDELSQVADALNEMAGKIQDKEKKLVLSIQSLQRANEEIETKRNEQLQIEKLASVGRLAAGVAHEVGNPLGAIAGYIDILRRSMVKSKKLNKEDIELCDRIEEESNRISRIIRALLQQARPAKDRIKAVPVKRIIDRSVELAMLPQEVDFEMDFKNEKASILVEEDQLVQVFLNLLLNAKHAVAVRKDKKKKGEIKVRCGERKLPLYTGDLKVKSQGKDRPYDTSMVRALKPLTYWVISVDDNGVGINEEDRKKLFEPFFSTKGPGKGTGLGLYVSKSIVESFDGAIAVRSALGYGSSFSVFLPQSERVNR